VRRLDQKPPLFGYLDERAHRLRTRCWDTRTQRLNLCRLPWFSVSVNVFYRSTTHGTSKHESNINFCNKFACTALRQQKIAEWVEGTHRKSRRRHGASIDTIENHPHSTRGGMHVRPNDNQKKNEHTRVARSSKRPNLTQKFLITRSIQWTKGAESTRVLRPIGRLSWVNCSGHPRKFLSFSKRAHSLGSHCKLSSDLT
jgi:hypothetical protein